MHQKSTLNRTTTISRLRSPETMQYFRDHGIEHVSLFGSFARGDTTEKSDLDLAMEYGENSTLSFFTYPAFIRGLKKKLAIKKIDTIDLKHGNLNFRRYIKKDLIKIF